MRLFRLLIVLSVIPLVVANAQNKITLDEAVKLAYENNIEVQKRYANIRNAEINLEKSSRLPNPQFSYSQENLKSSSFDYSEWIASGSIPINFLWDRWSDLDSKEKSVEAERILLNHQKNIIGAEVQENYLAANNYSALSQKLNKTLDRLTELAESAKHRLKEGDISEYEFKRILIELNKLQVTTKEIELQKVKYENSLNLLIGFDVSETIISGMNQIIKDVSSTKSELIKKALDNRNDLKSFQLIIESENLYLSHNKLKVIPNINLSAGYKEQLDNFKGAVFQVDFEIPLFNRNQTTIQRSENSLSLLKKEMLFLKKKIKSEVDEAYTRFTINKNLYEGRNSLQLGNLFETAVYSYEQGETSLVEFIDGINAFIDGSKIANEIEINYMQSFFELEKAVGITNFEKY